ncbi:MAG: TerB family tellurite resistance protein [Alphaproteobacteria bacterium]|nr:TerB family tellurite resistance protein [Alphaproteobacteria bacterium]
MVIKKIQELLGLNNAGSEASDGGDDVQLAAAALLVEVATVDRDFDDAERARILAFVRQRFALEEDIAAQLVTKAEAEVEGSVQLYAITSAIRQGLSYEDRVELMGCLWHVAYADGEADPFEDQLMRRIGELIYVTDRDRGETRKKAIAQIKRD